MIKKSTLRRWERATFCLKILWLINQLCSETKIARYNSYRPLKNSKYDVFQIKSCLPYDSAFHVMAPFCSYLVEPRDSEVSELNYTFNMEGSIFLGAVTLLTRHHPCTNFFGKITSIFFNHCGKPFQNRREFFDYANHSSPKEEDSSFTFNTICPVSMH